MKPAYCLYLFLILSLGQGMGQTTCKDVIADAGNLLKLKNLALERNQNLHRQYASKKREMGRKGLSLPSLYSKPFKVPDPDRPMYQDEKGTCRSGGTTWGSVKDIREYKLDSVRLENAILEVRIQNMTQNLKAQNTVSPKELEKVSYLGSPVKTNTVIAQRAAYAGHTYSFCIINPKKADLNIANKPIKNTNHGFKALHDYLNKRKKTLAFAMNAGMYKPNRQPVGLLIANGRSYSNLNSRKGKGNFFMQPNGVFGVRDDGSAFIYTTRSYANMRLSANTVWAATQSGPIMVLNGKINPKFTYKSENIHFRNAVGVRSDGKVIFAISEQRVNFYEFSSFLKKLLCVDALYLDGTVSRMYLPALNKYQDLEDSRHLGPILYIVE